MSRKSKQSKSAAHKQLKAQAKNRAAMKERLLKRQHRNKSFYDFLQEAYDLYDDGEYEEVRALLLQKFAQNPRAESDESLELLADTAVQLRDFSTIAKVYRKLTARVPDEVHFQVNYAAALATLMLPCLAKAAFEKLQKNWPDDPLTASAGETVQQLEQSIEEIYAKFPWTREERPALAVLHEEMMYGIAVNDFTHVIQYGEQLLARSPDFPPVYNNLAIAYRERGKLAEAVRTCEELLARNPDNPHAIVILGDTLYAQGRRREARAAWSRVNSLPAEMLNRADAVTRKLEAHIRLGEYAEALAAFEGGEDRNLFHDRDPQTAIDFHLAAVAAARLGQHRTASQYWTKALRINPNYDVAEENRHDHEQPVGERNGAWLEDRITWIPQDWADAVRGQRGERNLGRKMEDMIGKLATRLPELPDLITDTLTAGSPTQRKLAILICKGKLPALHERLRDFALSTYGTDKDRTSAVLWLQEQGFIRDKYVTVWVKGQQKEVKLLTAKISYEGKNDFSPAVAKLQEAGYRAIHQGDCVESERMYRKCLEQNGDHPSLLFNLAQALDLQDKSTEAERIKDDVIQRWPDYFFGRLEQAKRALNARDFERARQQLIDLGELDEYHISEITNLQFTWAELEIRVGQPEAAKMWIEQARQLDPDNPNLQMFEERLNPTGVMSFLRGLWK